jgi:hypothetical protein
MDIFLDVARGLMASTRGFQGRERLQNDGIELTTITSIHPQSSSSIPASENRKRAGRSGGHGGRPLIGRAQSTHEDDHHHALYDEFEDDGLREADDQARRAVKESKARPGYQDERIRERENWEKQMPTLQRSQINFRPLAFKLKSEEGMAKQCALQEMADKWWKTHGGDCIGSSFDGQQFVNKLTPIVDPRDMRAVRYQVEVITLEHRFLLGIPAWRCVSCQERIELDPQAVNCFPGTPCQPRTWLDKNLFEAMRVLGCKHGTSMTAFLEGLRKIHEQNGQDSSTTDLRAGWMERAFCAWLEVRTGIEMDSLNIMPDSTSPFRYCPICAFFPGGEDLPYARSCSCDMCNKASKFAHCGLTPGGPHFARRYGAAEVEIRRLEAENNLNLGHVVGDSQLKEAPPSCNAHLHCAKQEAAGTTQMEINGLVAWTCCHGIPGGGGAIDAKTTEQFAYYIVMLKHLLIDTGGKVKEAYIDFGCQFKKTFARFCERAGVEVPGAKDLKIMVNMMHGASHKFSCQYENNVRFVGDRHRDGEDAERFFQRVKVSSLCPITYLV